MCRLRGILIGAFFDGPEVLIAGVGALIVSVVVLDRLAGRF